MGSVLQHWVCELTFMQQSVLLTAIRGADGLPKRHVSKYLLRWLRRCVLYSAFDKCVLADPHDQRGGNFTGPIPQEHTITTVFRDYLKDVDQVPHHFHLHVVHAAEILGYMHPNEKIASDWQLFYRAACNDMHMTPETKEHMMQRLGDNMERWQSIGGEQLEDRRIETRAVFSDVATSEG